jgi:SAM-dependent methyltransferase
MTSPPDPARTAVLERDYSLGRGSPEHDRLQRQAVHLRGHTTALLDHVPITAGSALADLGCGPGGALDLLAERAGTTGTVVGVDLDPTRVEEARAFVRDRALTNVAVVNADARSSGLPSETFDLAHSRLLLTTSSRPDRVVAEMTRLLKPGGYAAALEADLLGLCYPPHPAWPRLTELLKRAFGVRSADTTVGRRLPEMLRGEGLVDVGVEARTEVCPPGHPQRSVIPDLIDNSRAKVIASGLIHAEELDELLIAVRRHLADARTVVVPVLYFLAWGRKPGAPAGGLGRSRRPTRVSFGRAGSIGLASATRARAGGEAR